jgi:hypothetical protein
LYEYDIALGQYKISVCYTKKPKGNIWYLPIYSHKWVIA